MKTHRERVVDQMIADGRLDPANRDLVLGFTPTAIEAPAPEPARLGQGWRIYWHDTRGRRIYAMRDA